MNRLENNQSPEIENSKAPYESTLTRLQDFESRVTHSLGIENMRWDITDTDLFPPELFNDPTTDKYSDTPDGRAEQIAKKISTAFSHTKKIPPTHILVFGLADTFIPAAHRLEKVMPSKKSEVISLVTQTAFLTLRNIQLSPTNRPASSHKSQLLSALLEGLNNYSEAKIPELNSADSDFMNSTWEDLSDNFHSRLENLDPENNESFMFVRNAVRFAESNHGDQKRFDGTLNRTHILRLGIRLLEDESFMSDPTPLHFKLSAALLHDVVEDTDATISEIEETFGTDVAVAVDALSKRKHGTNLDKSDDEYFQALYEQPKFVQIIKGHDRVDNLEALLQLDLNSEDRFEIIEKGIKYLDETYKFYPFAENDPHLSNRLQNAHTKAVKFYPTEVNIFSN